MHIIERNKLAETQIDIGGRDILIGFNEPSFRRSSKKVIEPDLDAKLNARFITYFLPAVEIARQQEKRPRFWIVSGLNMALKWNARNETERHIMIANNKLKFDFLKTFFETFFVNEFSIIEYIVAQDALRISEDTLLKIWRLVETEYPEEIKEIKYYLAKYKLPTSFPEPYQPETDMSALTEDMVIQGAFKYAISHIFAFGDVNFSGNYVLGQDGFASVGGQQETTFNKVRTLAIELIKRYGWLFIHEEITIKDNIQIVLTETKPTPVPYNGLHKIAGNGKTTIEEVTYENNRPLDFYDSHPKLKYQMEYMYSHLLSRKEYEDFWNSYRQQYFDLKERLREAYGICEAW